MTDETPPAAATLLLLRDDPFEVLMVHRNSRGAFASVMVFPGGRIDSGDADTAWQPFVEDYSSFDELERARRIAAIRETWEETSVLVGAIGGTGTSKASAALDFREFVQRSGARLRLGALTNFSHWVTPVDEPRRFDTYFYVASAPEGQVAIPDGSEIVGSEWVSPSGVAAAARRGEAPIIFPTLMNLDRLAESDSPASAISAALARPPFTVQPIFEVDENGGRVIVIPAEAGYAVTRFSF